VIGVPDKDLFNAAEPTIDGALADYAQTPFPALIGHFIQGMPWEHTSNIAAV